MGFIEDLGDEILKTDQQEAVTNAANAMSGMANKLWTQTDPLRQSMIDKWSNMLSGGFDVSQSPMFGQGKYNVESQFNTARNNIMEQLPSGGSLMNALANLEYQKAGSMANMMGNIAQDEYNKAYGMASGAPQTAISGMGGAGSLNQGMYGSKMGKTGDLGMGLGYWLGGKD